MIIKQFEDKNLAHFSYAILSNGEMAVIDPTRNPQVYYDFARDFEAEITTVIETHPHADFVSSHLEISQNTGANIYVSKWLGAEYPHERFDEGQAIVLGKIVLKALHTPGHSPDSISIVAISEDGSPKAVFTGDTLFVGDCGRPDLREHAGAITAQKSEMAKEMYYSLRNKLMSLPDDVVVYPAHGSGSLCGKGLGTQKFSTIGEEKQTNWSLQNMKEEIFVKELLHEQPIVPAYFPYDVEINKKGAPNFSDSITNVKRREPISCEGCANSLNPAFLIIDTRPESEFKQFHIKGAINLMNGAKFETWLGTIVRPDERFYLVAASDEELSELISRAAKIGYENHIELAFVLKHGNSKMELFDSHVLKENESAFTIVDIRNESEIKADKIFSNTIQIPLNELRSRADEIPLDKPILVHCAGGYRSAIGSSILQSLLDGKSKVFDLSEAVKEFKKEVLI